MAFLSASLIEAGKIPVEELRGVRSRRSFRYGRSAPCRRGLKEFRYGSLVHFALAGRLSKNVEDVPDQRQELVISEVVAAEGTVVPDEAKGHGKAITVIRLVQRIRPCYDEGDVTAELVKAVQQVGRWAALAALVVSDRQRDHSEFIS